MRFVVLGGFADTDLGGAPACLVEKRTGQDIIDRFLSIAGPWRPG